MNHYAHLFRLLHCSISQRINEVLSDMELTSSQGLVMGYLAHCDTPPCPKDIESAFQLTHPTVSGLLSRLEKKDFIRMEPDPEDGRCKRACIQPKGIACMETMHTAIEEIEAQIVRGFTEEEKTQLQSYLLRAAGNMGQCLCKHNSKEEIEE